MEFRTLAFCTLLLMSSYTISIARAGRRKANRDTNQMSYEPASRTQKSEGYYAAYRRAANLVNSDSNATPIDTCYGTSGKPQKCDVAAFQNVAINKLVTSTSTCGSPASRFCSASMDVYSRLTNQCQMCDANHNSRKHPPEYVVDSRNSTCWLSNTFEDPTKENNVSVTISLSKKYELTYIILNFCNKLPESLALYKSKDNGRTWKPLQYYSSDCLSTYGVEKNQIITRANEQEAICDDVYSKTNKYSHPRIAFSFHYGRPSAPNLDESRVLRDWVTVTDIKLEFLRLTKPGEQSTRPNKDDNYYSLSEVVLGGRCKCNGHASSCSIDEDGQARCDCKHNTEGTDCERCKRFYVDAPWQPATKENANECTACECNMHARRCQFNPNLYLLSSKTSGGMCVNCRHNTAGAHCQYCKPGFYRDLDRPITHKKTCKECICNTLGSVGSKCSETGQCICKDGVTGKQCDECKPGFQMTRSLTNPCEKIRRTSRDPRPTVKPPAPDIPVPRNPNPIGTDKCGDCRRLSEKLDLSKYCRSVYVVVAKITGKENLDSEWTRFNIEITKTYKREEVAGVSRRRREQSYAYVRRADLTCKCPKLRLNKTYLLVGVTSSSQTDGLLLDRQSVTVRYRDAWDVRVRALMNEERRQSCYRIV